MEEYDIFSDLPIDKYYIQLDDQLRKPLINKNLLNVVSRFKGIESEHITENFTVHVEIWTKYEIYGEDKRKSKKFKLIYYFDSDLPRPAPPGMNNYKIRVIPGGGVWEEGRSVKDRVISVIRRL